MKKLFLHFTRMALLFSSMCLFAADTIDGERVYRKHCDHCHGKKGEGVKGEYAEPLYGDKSIMALARYIHTDMPEDEPADVEDAEAKAVAEYIYKEFYSPIAWLRNHPPRIDYTHLTVRQHENALMDLLGGDRAIRAKQEGEGLQASYYSTRNFQEIALSFKRIDPVVNFNYGANTPAGIDYTKEIPQRKDEHKWIPGKSFSIRWSGSVFAPETGDYEFSVVSENGFRLKINEQESYTIDNYVAAIEGAPVRRAVSVRLLGGRSYPLSLEMFRYKDITASIELKWTPPHGLEEIIPSRVLSPKWSPRRFVMLTSFPADDSSVGYPRGTSVSAAWQQATAMAALEAAEYASANRLALAGTKEDDEDRDEKLKDWCRNFVTRAWRRALTDKEHKRMIQEVFKREDNQALVVRSVVLKTLISPHFLYTEPMPVKKGDQPDDFRVASRLALGLWDSVPNHALREKAAQGHLSTERQIRKAAQHMMADPRAHAKLHAFFQRWLMMEGDHDPAKDQHTFPEFNERIIADLRVSAYEMIDDLLVSKGSDYRQLFRAQKVYMNDRLAAFYDVDKAKETGFVPLSFDDGPRAGILTHPYLLASLSYSEMTSPIHRGVFVTRSLLGRHLRPPPDAVSFKNSEFDPSLTMREKVSRLTRPRDCRGCHNIINPLGFSLERYDAVGRFRTHDKNKPIVNKETYETSDGQRIQINGVHDLAEHIVTNESSHRAFVLQIFNQVAGQPVHAYGDEVLNVLTDEFRSNHFNIKNLVLECALVYALREGGQGEYP